MEYQTRNESGVTIIDLDGEIDVSQAPRLRKTIIDLLENNTTPLLINMSDVVYIDSAGLSVIIAAHRKARDTGTPFGLCGPQQPVRQVFHITGMDKVISIFADAEEGIAHLSKS
jgi:anti-sigma B factor antagonist